MEDDRAPNRRASQETLVSLLQLDPSPIDSPPSFSPAATDKELPTLPDEETNMGSSSSTVREGSTAAPGLSGSGRGAIYYLMRTQRLSSYAMAVFTSLHLANVSLIPAITRSVAGSETYLLMTREIYQTSITEPLLVALPVVAHVGSGVALRLLRRWQNMKRYGGSTPGLHALQKLRHEQNRGTSSLWPPLSYISISGYVFAVFYGAHVVMNRALPLAVEGDSSNIGLAYVAHGFARHPVVAGCAYVGLIAAASGHMVWGAARWLGWAPSTRSWFGGEGPAGPLDKSTKRQRRKRWFALQGAVVGTVALWAVGGMGVVSRGGLADGWVGKLYDGMFARVGL